MVMESLHLNDFWNIKDWAKPAMMWAIERELIVGDNWDLKPKANATRAEAAAIMMRFCEEIVK